MVKLAVDYQSLNEISRLILEELQADFIARDFSSDILEHEYVGVALALLTKKYCNNLGVTKLDFDIALEELENDGLIKTGPMAPFENPPGYMIVVIGFFSKREYAYLTKAGYKAAQRMKIPKRHESRPAQVHISGGNFHQSQIGIGDQIIQHQRVDAANDAEVIDRLLQVLSSNGATNDQATTSAVAQLVEITHRGDISEVKPIFQKLFSAVTESAKQVAWNILAAIITKQIGL